MSYTILVSILKRLFPTPPYVALAAVGVDFSATSIRCITLSREGRYLVPEKYIEKKFPEGSMEAGVIVDEKKFITFLKGIQKEHRFSYARITIPESQVFIFTVSFDKNKVTNIRKAIAPLIEEYTLLKTREAAFDYSILQTVGDAVVVQVVAAPLKVITNFVSAFAAAGIHVLSVELDAQAIARALVPENETGAQMIVDIGANHTGFSIVARGVVVYTETLSFGGSHLADRVSGKLGISLEEVENLKKNAGLVRSPESDAFFKVFSAELGVITGEIVRTFMFWQERRTLYGGFPEISKIYVCGGHSNMVGVADYIGAAIKLPVVLANPWTNCLDFDVIIPTLSAADAMSYVPAIGTALSNHVPSTNLLSQRLQEKIRHVRRLRLVSGVLWLSIAMMVAFGVLLIPSFLSAKTQKDSLEAVLRGRVAEGDMVDVAFIGMLENRIATLSTSVGGLLSDDGASEALRVVSSTVPQGVHIDSYEYVTTPQREVYIKGVVPIKQALDEYIANLQASDAVGEVESPLSNFLIEGESNFTLRVVMK